MTALARHIEAFLRDHLLRHRGASPHTCDSYAYSFRALFEFASVRLKTAPSALALEQLDAGLVGVFLEQLETSRRNGAATRNVRLAAIRAFFRFLQHREPAALDQIRRVLAIPFKRRDTRLVPYLTQDEVQALVNAPSPTTRQGIRDRAMLHLTICAGLRVSELTGLRLEDVAAQALTIRVRGKECHAYCTSFHRRGETTGTHAGRQACDLAFSAADVLPVVRRGIGVGPCTDAHGAGRVAPMSEPWAA
jgi:integrase/recombinase XerD